MTACSWASTKWAHLGRRRPRSRAAGLGRAGGRRAGRWPWTTTSSSTACGPSWSRPLGITGCARSRCASPAGRRRSPSTPRATSTASPPSTAALAARARRGPGRGRPGGRRHPRLHRLGSGGGGSVLRSRGWCARPAGALSPPVPSAPVSRPRRLLVGALAGALLSAGLPPFGWWPLALAGVAVAALVVLDRPLGPGRGSPWPSGSASSAPGLCWMTEFSAPGYVLAVLIESAFVGVGLAVAPPGRWSALGLAGALVLVEALRGAWPFGGVPVATLAQTQVGGPLALARAWAGPAGRRPRGARGPALAALGSGPDWSRHGPRCRWSASPPSWGSSRPGDRRGPASRWPSCRGAASGAHGPSETVRTSVFRPTWRPARTCPQGVDLVLWPEDVVDIDRCGPRDRRGRRAGRRWPDGSTPRWWSGWSRASTTQFRNDSVAWGPDGEVVGRYDEEPAGAVRRVHPVPLARPAGGRRQRRAPRCGHRRTTGPSCRPPGGPRRRDLLRGLLRPPGT